MPDKVYTMVDVVGVSEDSIHQAIRNALSRAGQTLRNIDWFEVKNIRGALLSGRVAFQVEVRIGMPWYSRRHVGISLTVLPGGEPAGNYPRNFAAEALKLDAEFHPFGQVCAASFE